MKKPINGQSDSRIATTVEYLRLAQRDMDRARTARLRYAHLGKSYGMTNAQIGSVIGLTEAAVRMLLKRNPETGALR